MEAVGLVAQILEPHREQFETLLKAERDMHSVGAILNPTLYRDMIYSKSFAQQIKVVRAAVAFLDEIAAVKSDLAPDNDDRTNDSTDSTSA